MKTTNIDPWRSAPHYLYRVEGNRHVLLKVETLGYLNANLPLFTPGDEPYPELVISPTKLAA